MMIKHFLIFEIAMVILPDSVLSQLASKYSNAKSVPTYKDFSINVHKTWYIWNISCIYDVDCVNYEINY